jgi:threonine synthase
LPNIPTEDRITLGEGNTSIVRSRAIGPSLGLKHLHFKLETGNPTGSYKDRFAAVAVSHLASVGAKICIGTSSGNTGAALAGYSAAAGIRCVLAIVDTAPLGKLTQMLAYGAELYRIRGFGTDPSITSEAMEGLVELAAQHESPVQISAFKYSPIGMEGVSSIAWELEEQLPDRLDHVFAPGGGGGLALGLAKESIRDGSAANRSPAVHCVQPQGNNTIAGPLREGKDRAVDCRCETKISGLQVASVIDGHDALLACRASGGTGWLVSDAQTFEMQKRLAREEGIFSEPAGAVAMAGIAKAAEAGELNADDVVVGLITGSGFKDIASIENMNSDREAPILDNYEQFAQRVRR